MDADDLQAAEIVSGILNREIEMPVHHSADFRILIDANGRRIAIRPSIDSMERLLKKIIKHLRIVATAISN